MVLQALLVTFREGLESFLIVGVILAYLRKTGRADLIRGVRAGLALALIGCAVGAYLWNQVPNQPLFEGIAALTAAVLVGAFLVQMLRVGRHMKADIEARIARVSHAAGSQGSGAAGATSPGEAGGRPPASWGMAAGVALVTALLVTREGLEAVLYLSIQARMAHGNGGATLIGAGVGVLLAAAVAWTWTRYAGKLNLGVVLKVTAVFLALFLFQLLVYGVHELAESGVIEGSQAFHDATEVVGPDGFIGHIISYSLLGAPLLYLVWARAARLKKQAAARGPERRPTPPATA